VLVCCERKLLLTGWWLVLVWCEKKYIISWLKKQPAEQSVNFCIGFLRLVPHPIVFLEFFRIRTAGKQGSAVISGHFFLHGDISLCSVGCG